MIEYYDKWTENYAMITGPTGIFWGKIDTLKRSSGKHLQFSPYVKSGDCPFNKHINGRSE